MRPVLRCFTRPRNRRPRASHAAAAAAALALLAWLALPGCGDKSLVLKVDILSYMDPGQRQFSFGPIPVQAGGIATGEQSVVPDAAVNLFGNFGDVAFVRAVSIRFAVTSEAYTGSGSDTLRMYLSDPDTDPRTTPAVVSQPITFTPAKAETLVTEIDGDARVLGLFQGKQLRVAVTSSLRGPDSGAPLSGSIRIDGLDAVVIAGRKAT